VKAMTVALLPSKSVVALSVGSCKSEGWKDDNNRYNSFHPKFCIYLGKPGYNAKSKTNSNSLGKNQLEGFMKIKLFVKLIESLIIIASIFMLGQIFWLAWVGWVVRESMDK